MGPKLLGSTWTLGSKLGFRSLELAVATGTQASNPKFTEPKSLWPHNAKCDKPPVMQKYTVVGKVRDAHGLKGELFIVVFAKVADWMAKLQTFDLVRKEMV